MRRIAVGVDAGGRVLEEGMLEKGKSEISSQLDSS